MYPELKFPDLPLLFGVPIYFLAPVVILTLIMGIFAERIYRFDVGLVYGRAVRKVKELIADLEDLKD